MAEIQDKKRLKDPYKLILLKEETLQEVGSYRLTLLNVYILVSVVLFITATIVMALIFFTPLKRYVPGYASVDNNPEYAALKRQLKDLESRFEEQQLYVARFSELVDAVPDDSVRAVRKTERPVQVPAAVTVGDDSNAGRELFDVTPLHNIREDASPLAYMYIVVPVKGQISRTFDKEAGHLGCDILAPKNTPIKAIMDGHVISADWTLETGNTIGIQHANNTVSFYKHNSRNLVTMGSIVKAGEAVAIIGNTGEMSTGPHLHFELWIDGQAVDPVDYIDFGQ